MRTKEFQQGWQDGAAGVDWNRRQENAATKKEANKNNKLAEANQMAGKWFDKIGGLTIW